MIQRFCLDANVFITSWNILYPINIFPSLWDRLGENKAKIILIKPIYDEIDPISDRNKSDNEKRGKHPLRMWLKDNGFTETPVDNRVEKISLGLEQKYEIDNNSKGANEQDIKLIAYAKENKLEIVTFEKIQTPNPPIKKTNYKIPLICDKEGVTHLVFVKMLENFGIKI